MSRRRRQEEEHEGNHERWLLTYSDMITLLLVLFIVMYTISTVNAQKFKSLAVQMGEAFGGSVSMSGVGMPPENSTVPSMVGSSSSSSSASSGSNSTAVDKRKQFEKVFNLIRQNIADNGLQDTIDVERGDSYILIRFKDSVLFYGDSDTMRPEAKPILKYIGQTLVTINSLIEKILIEGHTAEISGSESDIFGWQLSADRAIAVLKYFSDTNHLPQSKMSIAGYSNYHPIASNNTESGRAKNRRVEVRITQVGDKVTSSTTSSKKSTSNNTTSTSTSTSSKK